MSFINLFYLGKSLKALELLCLITAKARHRKQKNAKKSLIIQHTIQKFKVIYKRLLYLIIIHIQIF